MANRYVVLIDESPQSIANVYCENSLFKHWIRCFSRINEAFDFIRQLQPPCRTIVYLSKDNLFDLCPSPILDGPAIELIEVLNRLRTIHQVHIFGSTTNFELEKQWAFNNYPRLIGEICSLTVLPILLAAEGQLHLTQEMNHYANQQEPYVAVVNLPLIQQLIDYMGRVMLERKAEIVRQIEKRAEQSGEPPT